MATRVRSFAKVNVGLAIGPARADGFHGLATVYQTIGLHDFVTVSAKPARETSIHLTSSHPRVPLNSSNTAWRMVEKALAALAVRAEVTIDIDKRLPIQGGLGAGSANAVASLAALERELGHALPGAERLRFAAEVGSEVPLFVLGGTVLGLGRGEEVYPLPDPADAGSAIPCLVATPEIGVSTPKAFHDWDSLQASTPAGTPASAGALTTPQPSDRLSKLSRAVSGVWSGPHSSGVSQPSNNALTGLKGDLAENPLLALVRTGIENDFESVVFSQHPLLGTIKRAFLDTKQPDEPALFASLSGSGASVFGLYPSITAAETTQQRLQQLGVSSFLTETLTRTRYWASMFVN